MRLVRTASSIAIFINALWAWSGIKRHVSMFFGPWWVMVGMGAA
jgi:hypothetical protein